MTDRSILTMSTPTSCSSEIDDGAICPSGLVCRAGALASAPTAAMRSPVMPMSAANHGSPEPSTTRPLRMR